MLMGYFLETKALAVLNAAMNVDLSNKSKMFVLLTAADGVQPDKLYDVCRSLFTFNRFRCGRSTTQTLRKFVFS